VSCEEKRKRVVILKFGNIFGQSCHDQRDRIILPDHDLVNGRELPDLLRGHDLVDRNQQILFFF